MGALLQDLRFGLRVMEGAAAEGGEPGSEDRAGIDQIGIKVFTDFNNGLLPPLGPFDPSGYSNGNGPARGRISSFPDNSMTVVSFMGLYKFSKKTNLNGTIQIIAELDGEKVIRADVHCGYLHRGFEKECESHTWHNLIPYVDRLNYCSALINDFAYCEAVEKLMGIEITPRCRYLRTLLSEYSRLVDHLTCLAAGLMELGAMTAFLYLVMIRDYMYEHLAALTGARVTYTALKISRVIQALKRLEVQ